MPSATQAKGMPEPEEALIASHGNFSSTNPLTCRAIVLSQGAPTLCYKKAKERAHRRGDLCPLQAVREAQFIF
jgi:hypothetical protein